MTPTMQTNTKTGRARVMIEGVDPEIDCGRYPIKRVVGEKVVVEADMFGDGHDSLSCALLYRKKGETKWQQTPMEFLVNDRWRGVFTVRELGVYEYTLKGWIDHFKTWRRDLKKRLDAAQNVAVDLLIGGHLVQHASTIAGHQDDGKKLAEAAEMLLSSAPPEEKTHAALSEWLNELMLRNPDLRHASLYSKTLSVVVDPERAGFSSWYEMFPRSTSDEPGKHGTFRDCEARLPYVASMGFDVLYLPPVHPIGDKFRKGKNNNPVGEAGDVGSPWAIGNTEGGHKAILPELGSLDDFRSLVKAAHAHGIDVALDIAFQCSPDHPWVKEHPEWFKSRPDGTIQYAENPPKKYQDIYPIDFESEKWSELWDELKSVFIFWIEQGVTIFRVDNPHTKSLAFWEWCIRDIKKEYPQAIFLSEAFTRPKVMYRLAKLGFTQSYTYFAWRNSKEELTEYMTELTRTEVAEFFRPNFWPNTPDILTEFLQNGGRPAFMLRLALAATLTASYGIYGPAFELGLNMPVRRGSEEYLNSEKYEVKDWQLNDPRSLRDFIGRVNRIRHENPALQSNRTLHFHDIDNPNLICYSKHSDDLRDIIVVIVNLSPYQTQAGWTHLRWFELGVDMHDYEVHDLLSDTRYVWHGAYNYVELNPYVMPAHIFHIDRRGHTEEDFPTY